MESGARVRYRQDLAEFIPITDGARLIQERTGLSEDEAREDIVAALRARDRDLKVRFWSRYRGERSRCRTDILLGKLLNNLIPDLIDWESSIARRRDESGYQFEVEIEVSRAGVCCLWLAPGGTEDRNDERPDTTTGGADEGKAAELPELKQDDGRPPDKQPRSVGRPTRKTEIVAAYEEIRDAGEINYDAPKACLYEQIREKVQERKRAPTLKGLQAEAIRKAIEALFEVDKNKRSTSP